MLTDTALSSLIRGCRPPTKAGLNGEITEVEVVGVPESVSKDGRLWSAEDRVANCEENPVLNMVDTGRSFNPTNSADVGGALLGIRRVGFSSVLEGPVVGVVGICVASLALGDAER